MAARTICTLSANFAVVDDPAPKKPSPIATARRSAVSPFAPIQTGGYGF